MGKENLFENLVALSIGVGLAALVVFVIGPALGWW